MRTMMAAIISSFVISVVLTPVVRRIALSLGFTDDREMDRKVHRSRVSRLGGLVMFVAFLVPLAGLYFYDNGVARAVFSDMGRFSAFFLLAGAAFFIGLADDIRGLPANLRLAAQIAIGAASYFAGFRFETIGIFGAAIHLPAIVAFTVTVLWFVLVINAINLIDGLDGLAGGIVIIITATLGVVSFLHGALFLSVVSALLLGSLGGFLCYNCKPSFIFMGDGGAYFLGYAMAALTLDASMKSTAACVVLMPLLALAVPILDASLAFLRRLWRGIPISHADMGHVHHRLLKMGFSPAQVTAILYVLTSALCVLALASAAEGKYLVPASLVVVGVTAVIISLLTGFDGMRRAVRFAVEKYAERRRRFAAVEAARRAAARGEPLPEVFRRCAHACEVLKCEGLRLVFSRPGGRLKELAWNSPDTSAEVLLRKLNIPIGSNGGLRGEVVFSIAEELADVFNRDKDYFETLKRSLEKAAERHVGLSAPAGSGGIPALGLSAGTLARRTTMR